MKCAYSSKPADCPSRVAAKAWNGVRRMLRRNGATVIKLRITREGMIYGISEEFPLVNLGRVENHRLSRVEWNERKQEWGIWSYIDRDVIGPGFATRKAALAFERDYMDRRLSRIKKALRRAALPLE